MPQGDSAVQRLPAAQGDSSAPAAAEAACRCRAPEGCLCCADAALTSGMRVLLRQYEARPPPLAPLALSLRALTSLCANREVNAVLSDC